MTPGQPVTPRYQLLMGPWQHVTTGTGVNISALELEWFDTWMLGERTPLSTTTTPLHLDVRNSGPGTGTWVDAAQWPLPETEPTSSSSDSDRVLWTGVTSPCDVQTDQWGAGLLALGFETFDTKDPCDLDDVSLGAGPEALVYTSAPVATPEVV